LLSGIASDGLAATLSGQRFGHLVGGDRFTVLDACTAPKHCDRPDLRVHRAPLETPLHPRIRAIVVCAERLE
jgi:hypothetical protein